MGETTRTVMPPHDPTLRPPVRLHDGPAEVENVMDAQHRGAGRPIGPHDIGRIAPPLQPFALTSDYAELRGMDIWLDNLETLSHAIAQRRLTESQRDRLYGLLERMYTDARQRRRSRA